MAQRRIVTFNHVSADGYFSAADGNLDWFMPDEEIEQVGAQAGDEYDTMLLGRRTYDLFESFWPHALDDPTTAADPHAPGRRTESMRDLAVWLNSATKLVFSTTRKEAAWNNSHLLREIDPREIQALKAQPGKGMIVFGSGSLASQLTQHGLIDEYQFVVNPIVLGSGLPFLSGVTKGTRLDLLEAKPFRSGNVLLRYACRG